MKTPLINMFEMQLKALTGFDFQEIVVKIFQFKYRETGFTDIRRQKDKGNDGIVESEKRVIACFGPEETQNTKKRQKDFEDKTNFDFKKYQTHWQAQYPNWSIVINHKIDPRYDKIVKGLSANATVIGLEQLLTMVENMKNHQRRMLGKYLRIDNNLFALDYIREILEDLLNGEDVEAKTDYNPKNLLEISSKIEINFIQSEIEDAKSEYENFLIDGLFNQVHSLLYGYEDTEIKKIKNRAIYDYVNKSNGLFKQRLNQLTNLYIEKYSAENDDDYLYYIRGVLLYLFEQCLIGIKTELER